MPKLTFSTFKSYATGSLWEEFKRDNTLVRALQNYFLPVEKATEQGNGKPFRVFKFLLLIFDRLDFTRFLKHPDSKFQLKMLGGMSPMLT